MMREMRSETTADAAVRTGEKVVHPTRRQVVTGAIAMTAAGVAGTASARAAFAATDSKAGSKNAATTSDTTASDVAGGIATIGEGVGKHGHLSVEVVTDDGKIVRINVLESRETKGIGDVCMEKLTRLIVDKQTLNVDMVAGATLSSAAFLAAVGEALDAAGEDSSAWQKRAHAAEAAPTDLADDYDVVVIGTGGAGFTAAISAANDGMRVLLMEKLGYHGGSTALSGGEMAVPGNWIQRREGIEDSPEQLASDMLAGGDNRGDPDLVSVIANGVFDAAQWLTYEGGVSWEHDLLFFGGHSVKRSIIPTGHIGNAMTCALTRRARGMNNLTLVDDMRATELVVDANGAICGVRAESTVTGDAYEFGCAAVVLTTGGFGANTAMRAQYNPDYGDQFRSTDSVGAQGEGIVMAQALGADVVDMDLIQTYPICDIETGALLYLDDMRLYDRTVMFNKEGRRFVEELDRRDVLSRAILAQTGSVAYEIWDQAADDATHVVETHADEFDNLTSRGLCVRANTLEEACEPFGIDAGGLKATIERWNEMCDAGKDEDFNYRAEMHRIETPPFYVMVYAPAVHYTMGGLRINTDAQVLATSGEPISGLYAAGEVAGGKMGTNRLGSTSMADIYTFGRVAGDNAAAYVAGKGGGVSASVDKA